MMALADHRNRRAANGADRSYASRAILTGAETCGYPLLLQSREAYNAGAIHDRQHPHDFFMGIGATYERALNKHVGLSLYATASGEPALGPVAFMHRPSAMDIPKA